VLRIKRGLALVVESDTPHTGSSDITPDPTGYNVTRPGKPSEFMPLYPSAVDL